MSDINSLDDMEIIYFSSEVAPFSKRGGMGDVVGNLPVELSKKGRDVTLITPYYSVIETDKTIDFNIEKFEVSLGQETYECSVHHLSEKNYKFEIVFIDNKKFFDRDGIYTNKSGEMFEDTFLRYLFFQRAGLRYLQRNEHTPEIVHCHDNQSALVPVYIKYKLNEEDTFKNTKTIFTLHNIGYQSLEGFFQKQYLDFPEKFYEPTGLLEWYGQINPVKGGILAADKVTTVSETHAEEIMTDEKLSAGLKDVIQSRDDEVIGILNGIDEREWDPSSDDYIAYNYSLANTAGKKNNKKDLLKNCNLPKDSLSIPVFGLVSRLVGQKGIDLLIDIMDDILALNIKVVILGSGRKEFHYQLERVAEETPNQVYIDLSYNQKLAHQIMAGSDFLLMPSRYEPCGITQMAAMRYGTIPIVHKTGGLADTVQEGETGFLFEDYDQKSMLQTVRRALETYTNTSEFEDMIINCMNQDFSWEKSVTKYLALYKDLAKN